MKSFLFDVAAVLNALNVLACAGSMALALVTFGVTTNPLALIAVPIGAALTVAFARLTAYCWDEARWHR
ncbi:hypothetical protein ASC66_01105 [Leifsonia sp. Root4]|uniref:hypothetical protein n=1 Tax=Leifsonia sp. Root4 TaxID=1736525 RepID=UPI0006F5BA08|nr:hypothetical protein [Leifsonia sp. Root4]KQW07626.1 hypothetical protein ASC66_01105 [Leifsonia sp. Root4]